MPKTCDSGVKKKRKDKTLNKQSTGPTEGEIWTKRRKYALRLIGQALHNNTKVNNADDIQLILQDHCEETGTDADFFNCLSKEDLFNIFIEIKNDASGLTVSEVKDASNRTPIRNGQPTPECSHHENDEQTKEGEHVEEGESDEGPLKPVDDVSVPSP
jgi:hypothetical protein